MRDAQVSAGPRLHQWLWLVPLVLLGHGLLLTGVPLPSGDGPKSSPAVLQVHTVLAPVAVKLPPRRAPAPAVRTTDPEPSAPVEPVSDEETVAEPMNDASRPQAMQMPQENVVPTVASGDVPVTTSEPAQASVPAGQVWPLMTASNLPAPILLRYDLSGMDKGLNYAASGELRWQHNGTRYDLDLSVRAFLLGSRHWRSAGRIGAYGLEPERFSDSWRSERAAHFDRDNGRVVFSSTSHPAALEEGAQDQVSLYVQLAAAMAADPVRFGSGARLQVQTVTTREGLPWSLQLEGEDTVVVGGKSRQALKWTALPHQRYSAQVVFWVVPELAWLPLRIRITQVSGSYIDLLLNGSQPLPALVGGE